MTSKLVLLENKKSNNYGDSSQIGLECDSGNFDDCTVEATMIERSDCKGVLIFSNVTTSCGSQCFNEIYTNQTTFRNMKEPKRSGWTQYVRYENIALTSLKNFLVLIHRMELVTTKIISHTKTI